MPARETARSYLPWKAVDRVMASQVINLRSVIHDRRKAPATRLQTIRPNVRRTVFAASDLLENLARMPRQFEQCLVTFERLAQTSGEGRSAEAVEDNRLPPVFPRNDAAAIPSADTIATVTPVRVALAPPLHRTFARLELSISDLLDRDGFFYVWVLGSGAVSLILATVVVFSV
jgi:hypothetical protein